MFGIDFFPTKVETIEKMLLYSDVIDKVVLEPSAGNGNIVEYVQQAGAKEVLACEIDANLRAILSTKCEIIAHDFLTLKKEDISHIHMIIMNPPFSKQVDHILHAWEIAPPGCEIITLCTDTLTNRFSHNKREYQIIELVENHGSSRSLGQCFKDAERKTEVWVGCLRLFKDGEPGMEFNGYFEMENEDIIDKHEEGLQSYNYIRDVVGRYVEILKNWDAVRAAEKHMNDMMSFFPFGITFGASVSSNESGHITKESFQKKLQASAWRMIFDQCKINKYMTSGVRSDLNKFIQNQVDVPFTVKNVYKMIQMIVGTHGSRMDKVIVEAFEAICQYSELNSSAGDKWKTNTNFLLNKKFIIPYICDYDKKYPILCKHTCVKGESRLEDIVKGLCFLTGTKYEETTDLRSSVNRNNIPWGETFTWEFFICKGHKSGTMHFTFKDPDILFKFNKRYGEIKGWNLSNEKPKRSNSKKKAEEASKQGTEVYCEPLIVNNEYQLF
jgi:hypothetical protein